MLSVVSSAFLCDEGVDVKGQNYKVMAKKLMSTLHNSDNALCGDVDKIYFIYEVSRDYGIVFCKDRHTHDIFVSKSNGHLDVGCVSNHLSNIVDVELNWEVGGTLDNLIARCNSIPRIRRLFTSVHRVIVTLESAEDASFALTTLQKLVHSNDHISVRQIPLTEFSLFYCNYSGSMLFGELEQWIESIEKVSFVAHIQNRLKSQFSVIAALVCVRSVQRDGVDEMKEVEHLCIICATQLDRDCLSGISGALELLPSCCISFGAASRPKTPVANALAELSLFTQGDDEWNFSEDRNMNELQQRIGFDNPCPLVSESGFKGSAKRFSHEAIYSISDTPAVSGNSSQVLLDLQFQSVAVFFQQLVNWGGTTRSRPVPTGFLCCNLFGEEEFGSAVFGSDADQGTWLRVEMDLAAKKFYLIVGGDSSSAVDKRARRLGMMIEETLRHRQVHELPGWQTQHRLAMVGSEAILQQQNASRACVVFHYSGATSLAEIVALKPHQHQSVLRYLEKLKPREVVWEVPAKNIEAYDDLQWEQLRVRYSVHREWLVKRAGSTRPVSFDSNPQVSLSSVCFLKVWGFAPLLDEAAVVIQRGVNAQFAGRTEFISTAKVSPISDLKVLIPPRAFTPIQPVIRKVCTGAFAFRDREAGIFYFAFEKHFRDFIAQSFSVVVEEMDRAEQQQEQGRDSRRNGLYLCESGEARNSVMKISFYGNSQSSISAVRNYLEQLNPTNLVRVQIFFPQVHAPKYKELNNQRSVQLSALSNMRLQAMANVASGHLTGSRGEAVVDPMQCRGFVNVRIKPPLHPSGMRKMPLPADCTVTLCGSVLVSDHAKIVREIEASFESVGSEYLCSSVAVSFSHPLKKQLTVKTLRECFMQRHGLVGLKWEEGSRMTGSVGTAKLWAPSYANMQSALAEIQLGAEESEGEEHNQEILLHQCNNFLNSCSSGSGERSSAVSPEGILYPFEAFRLGPRDSLGNGGFDSYQMAENVCKSVIYWPDDSLRFVLLSDPLSGELNRILSECSAKGVLAKYPYRDRSNPSAGILLEGGAAAVSETSTALNMFLDAAAAQLRTVQVVLPHALFSELVAHELEGVKFVQGQAGVRIKLDAKQREIAAETRSVFDLRLVAPGTNNPLLTVRVRNGRSAHSVEVAVISNKAAELGGRSGVSSLLVVVDAAGLARFKQADAERIQMGEVVVQSDTFTGETVLVVGPVSANLQGGADRQARELVRILQKGLSVADELQLHCVAVAAPVLDEGFSLLSGDGIRCLVVEAVVEFAATHTIRSVRRLVCLELQNPLARDGFGSDANALAVNTEAEKRLVPGSADRMTQALLSLLEQQAFVAPNQRRTPSPTAFSVLHGDHWGQGASSGGQLALVQSSVALPVSLAPPPLFARSADPWDMCSGNAGQQEHHSVLVRGLGCGVLLAVDLLRDLAGGKGRNCLYQL